MSEEQGLPELRASRSSPAGLLHLRTWSGSALAPLAEGLEDLADLFVERSGAASGTSSASFSKSASFSALCPQEASDAPVPTARVRGPARLRAPLGSRAALRLRAMLILAALLGSLHTCRRWASERGEEAPQRVQAAAAADATERSYLKVGSVYQNEYMTLWNENGGPISVTLEVGEGDTFELKVSHLNSIHNGNEGWFIIRGNFGIETNEDKEHMKRLMVEHLPKDQQGFLYDKKVLERAARIAFKCVERVGILGIVQLAANSKEDTVLVTPSSSIVRLLWNEPVVLRPTAREDLWAPNATQNATQP